MAETHRIHPTFESSISSGTNSHLGLLAFAIAFTDIGSSRLELRWSTASVPIHCIHKSFAEIDAARLLRYALAGR